MRTYFHILKDALFGILYAFVVSTSAAQGYMMKNAPPAPPPAQSQAALSGTIDRIVGATIFVILNDSTVTPVNIRADTLILGRKSVGLDSIQADEALGVAAAIEKDGSLTATAINVFPLELWQRARKGQFPMSNGQIMTNAKVEKLGVGVQGRTLFLKYEMLTAVIAVPDGIPINRSIALKLSDLKPGQKVTIRGQVGSGGIFDATSISLDLS